MSFPKKKLNKLVGGMKEEIDAMDKETLEKSIIECENNVLAVEKEREADSKLETLKEDLKALSGGYRDAISTQRAKIDYCVYCLNGGDAGED